MAELSLKERMALSPEEKKRRYQQAVKPFIDKNFKNGVVSAENYIGTNDSPTAGLTKENFARSTEGYAANNDGTYRYRATRELGIPDQIDQNPKYAARDRMQYYLIDHPNAFDSPRELKTANDWWGQIYTIMSQDSQRGNALAEQARYFSTQYGNPLYNPYQTSTLSKDIKNLFGLESFSKEWVAENYNLLNALELTDAGNPKAPSDKSTPEQILAYHYSKILDAEANTLKAEQELADLKAQISSKVANAKLYGTGQSVDDIYKSLEMDNYTTLKAMEDNKLKAQPFTLTRAVNYNDDVVYAMIQAAMDADDSDISGITDFTEAGANYSNNKYVDSQEKREQLYQKFYEDERERYRQEQDALLTGDTSAQEKYKAREIAHPETKGWNSAVFDRPSEPKESVAKKDETSKSGSWADVDFTNPNNVNLSAKAPEVSVGAVPRNNANSKPNAAISPVQTITERPGMATMPGMERYQMVPYMDQKEVEEYNRIFDSEGLNAADEYYYSLTEILNRRAADQKIEELSGNRPAQVMYGFVNGLVSTGEGWAQMLSADVRPDTVSSLVSQAIKEETGDVADVLYDVTTSVGAMAPSILLSIVSGNLGAIFGMTTKAASTLGQVVAGVSTLFSSGGNAYNEVMKSGEYSVGQAKSYATLVGASEALLSYALSGVSALGGKLWGKVGATKIAGNVAQTIKHTDNAFLRIAGKGLLPAVEEGTEEWVQAVIEPVLKNAILGTDEDMNPFSENALYSAFLGAITGGLLESGSSAIEAGVEVRDERNIGRDIIESGKRDRLIQAAKQSNNADVRQAAEALEAGTVRATEGMIGQLAIEYKDAGGDISFLSDPIEPEVQPTVTGITTDYDTAQALTRAMRGEATESDLDLLEKSADIPNHEDTVKEISAAAKEFKAVLKANEDKESQLFQLKNDMTKARRALDKAKVALAEHQRGVVLAQQGETLEAVLVEKQKLEAQINSLMDEAERVSTAGLEPTDQMQKAEVLNTQLDAVNTKYNQLVAAGREATVFHGQITNSQKAYNAAERNYNVAEDEYYAMQPIYNAALDNFRDRVAKAVNTAFGSNALGMLGVSENKSSGTVDMNAPEEPDMSNYYEVYNQLNREDKAEADYAQNIIQSDMEYKKGSIPEDIKESVKTDLRGRRLALTDTQQQEIASITDTYGDFRKNMMGKITLAADGASLDSVWSELSDSYPTLFPANTSEGEQVRILANTLNELYPKTAKNQGVRYARASVDMPSIQANQMRSEPVSNPSRSSNRRVVSLQQSMDNAANALGVGLQKGRTNYRRDLRNTTLGYHNGYSNGINIQTGVDMPVFAHEVGHALDERYNLVANNPFAVASMVNNLPQAFQDAYNNERDVLTHEAIAEFVSMFVTNPARAQEFAGTDFYNAFVDTLSREDLRTLERVRSDYNDFVNADIGSQIAGTIRSYSDPVSDGQSTIEKFITNYIDKFDPLRQVDQNVRNKSGNRAEVLGVEGLAKNALYARQTASELITGHMFDPNNNAIAGVGSFTEALSGLRGREDYNTFVQYCKAKHAIDWAAQGRDVFPENVDYRAFVNQIETNDANQRFVEAHKQLMRTWDAFMQSWVVNEGFISRAAYEEMRRLNPNYVPNFRVMSNAQGVQESGGTGSDSASPSAGIVKRASERGSTLDTYDPIESMIKMVESMVATQRQNAILRQFDTLYRTQEGMSDILMPANKDMTGTNVSELLNRIGRGTTNMDIVLAANDLLEALGNDFTLFNIDQRASGPRVINAVRTDGSVASYEIQSQAVYDSLVGVAQHGKDVLSMAAKVSRTLNSLLTVKNPLFWIPNAARDVANLMAYGTEENPLRVVRNLTRAFGIKISESAPVTWTAEALRRRGLNIPEWNNELYQQYHAMGGGSGQGMSLSTPKSALEIKKDLVKGYHDQSKWREMGSWMTRIGNAIESVGDFFEDNTRFAEFLAGLERYGTDSNGQQLAFRKSRTVTTEFAIQGKTTRGLNIFFRFCSANINGNYQQIRQLFDSSTGRNGTKITRNLAYASVLGVVAELILRAYGGDDYEKIADDIRMTHWCIPTKLFGDLGKALGMREGDYIRIPKPQGVVQSLFNLPVVIASGYMSGQLDTELQNGITSLLESINPFSSPIWSGVTDALRNRTYYGDEIEPGYLEDLPMSDRYNDTTPDWAIKSASTLNAISKSFGGDDIISPMKLQYVVEQYSGVLGKMALPFFENFDNPAAAFGSILDSFTQRMTINGYYTNDIKNEFKLNKNELNEILTSYKKERASTELNMHLSESEKEQAIIDLDNLLNGEDQLAGIDEKISAEWGIIREITDDPNMTEDEKERKTLEHRKNIYNYQAQGNLAMEMWLEKYGPERNLFQYLRQGSVIDRTDTKWKSVIQNMPDSFQSYSDNTLITKMRSFYEQDPSKTTFTPKYPPSFVDSDNVLTAWEDVDSQIKTSMEKAWTDAYMSELASNGFATVTDYDTAKSLASKATSKANAAAKEIYKIKYSFKE